MDKKKKNEMMIEEIIGKARVEAKNMGNNFIGTEHLLLAIMKDSSSTLSKQLEVEGIDYFELKEYLSILFGIQDDEVKCVKLSRQVEDIINHCKNEYELIDIDAISVALLETRCDNVAKTALEGYELDIENLIDAIKCNSDAFTETSKIVKKIKSLGNHCSVIEVDKHKQILGRDTEIFRIWTSLSKRTKSNALLLGEPGVGKTAIVEEMARQIKTKECPKRFENYILVQLDVNAIVAGTKYRGEFEAKMNDMLKMLLKYKDNIILFIDEIHGMIDAGKSEGSIDVSSVLKPHLARNDIHLIGSTTLDEYKEFIKPDKALERRFDTIEILEPKVEKLKDMVQAKINDLQKYHKVKINEQLIDYCISKTDNIKNRYFPDKLLDVIDFSMALAEMKNTSQVKEDFIDEYLLANGYQKDNNNDKCKLLC